MRMDGLLGSISRAFKFAAEVFADVMPDFVAGGATFPAPRLLAKTNAASRAITINPAPAIRAEFMAVHRNERFRDDV